MAKRILSEQPIFFTGDISNRAGNLERIFEAIGKRSAEESRQAMRSIQRKQR